MTSYLSEKDAENLQNGDVHFAQIPDFEMGDISRAIWRIEVSDSSFFSLHFHAFPFELYFFIDRSFGNL